MHKVELPIDRYDMEGGCFTYHFEEAYICEYCYRDVDTCRSCGKKTILNRDTWDAGRGRFCMACNDSSIVFDCGTKNTPVFYNVDGATSRKSGSVYMGVELEVCVKDGNPIGKSAIQVQESLGEFVFLKWDGSVNNGFEIVSQPATLDFHYNIWNDFFALNASQEILREVDVSCGMHIHVGRLGLKARNEKIFDRLSYLVFSRANREFMETVAGRAGNNYASFHRRYGDKYQALNLSPIETIEFRMFQSDVNRDVFIKNLEAVKAMVDYCSYPQTMPKGSSNYVEFCKFVASHSTEYPFFTAFLEKHKFIHSDMGEPLLDWVVKMSDLKKIDKKIRKKVSEEESSEKKAKEAFNKIDLSALYDRINNEFDFNNAVLKIQEGFYDDDDNKKVTLTF
jgi:hypothetical protein